jgi:hypothetical protein
LIHINCWSKLSGHPVVFPEQGQASVLIAVCSCRSVVSANGRPAVADLSPSPQWPGVSDNGLNLARTQWVSRRVRGRHHDEESSLTRKRAADGGEELADEDRG